MFKKNIILFISLILFCLTTTKIKAEESIPELYAQGIYLMDAKTGQVLYEKNAHIQYAPASTTKVMTAIIALEKCELSDEVIIGEKPTFVDGTAIGLKAGEVYTMEALLHALLLESGNDCAEAIAEHIAGSNEAFGEIMTEKAKEIGAKNTVFKNPSGLPQDGHLTTAHDLALIMQYANNNEDLNKILQANSFVFNEESNRIVYNKNPLLRKNSVYEYDYAYTGKTGYTIAANHCYIATAKKDDQVLVASFLKAANKDAHYKSVSKLFDWGFNNYKTEMLVSKGEKISDLKLGFSKSADLVANDNIYYTIKNNENIISIIENMEIQFDKNSYNKKSVKANTVLFNADVMINGEKYKSLEIVSPKDVISLEDQIYNFIKNNKNKILFSSLIILIVIYKAKKTIAKRKRKKRFKRMRNAIKK